MHFALVDAVASDTVSIRAGGADIVSDDGVARGQPSRQLLG